MPVAEALLIITGSMGSGKTTVMAEASDLLTLRLIPHAAVDVDALGVAHLAPARSDDDVMYRNLRCVWENCAAAGVRRVLLARALETEAELERCRSDVPATAIVICRLNASMETMQQRVRWREPGIWQQKFIERAAELEAALDNAHLEDFSVANDNRSVSEVAREVLGRARWI